MQKELQGDDKTMGEITESGYELAGLIQMYQAAGEAEYEKMAMDRIHNRPGGGKGEQLLSGAQAGAYLFAFRQTGDEKYRKAAESVFQGLESGTEKKCEPVMPFFTEYDTLWNQKAHYGEVAAFFEGKDSWSGSDVAALADTIGKMSMEIYEYYRALCDLFKRVIRSEQRLEALYQDGPISSDLALTGYAVLKACNLGVLNREKYGEAGIAAWKRYEAQDGSGIGNMLKAQYLIFQRTV